MTETIRNIDKISSNEEEKTWLRQTGESILWFNRFRRYLELGPQRTLLAAVEQEHGTIKALKSTQKEMPGNKKRQGKHAQLVAVAPLAQRPQAPGSWKKAAITWQWRERAKLYDEHLIDTLTDNHVNSILEKSLTSSLSRIDALHTLFDVTKEHFNSGYKGMTYEQESTFLARMQSIIKDIREEMKTFDASLARSLARERSARLYNQLTIDEFMRGKERKREDLDT